MRPDMLDLLLVIAFGVLFPIQGIRWRKQKELDRAQGKTAMMRDYAMTLVWQWAFAAVLAIVWISRARDWTPLGFQPAGGWGFWVTLVPALAVVVMLGRQARLARTRAGFAARVRPLGDSIAYLLPNNAGEMRLFYAVGVTAGFVEELLFRGYLIWYASNFMPIAAAVIVSSLVFGIGHSYQGPRGILKTGSVGLALSGIYLLSGSLWIPMMLHAAADILQVRMLYNARTFPVSEPPVSLNAAA